MTDLPVDLSKVVPISDMKGDDDDEARALQVMAQEAEAFLRSFAWCQGVEESYLGIGVPGVVGVFLFKQKPSRLDVDPWLWVVVGDVPPAYITTDDAPNPASALDAYIGAMNSWVEAVKQGRPVRDLIPVNAPPSLKYATMLESRLAFLDQEILSVYSADLCAPH